MLKVDVKAYTMYVFRCISDVFRMKQIKIPILIYTLISFSEKDQMILQIFLFQNLFKGDIFELLETFVLEDLLKICKLLVPYAHMSFLTNLLVKPLIYNLYLQMINNAPSHQTFYSENNVTYLYPSAFWQMLLSQSATIAYKVKIHLKTP